MQELSQEFEMHNHLCIGCGLAYEETDSPCMMGHVDHEYGYCGDYKEETDGRCINRKHLALVSRLMSIGWKLEQVGIDLDRIKAEDFPPQVDWAFVRDNRHSYKETGRLMQDMARQLARYYTA